MDGVPVILQSLHQEEEQQIEILDFFQQIRYNKVLLSIQVILLFYLGSQICNLLFSKISNEMVTTLGYSLNKINVWNTTSNWE